MKKEEINYDFLNEYFPEITEEPFFDPEEEKEYFFRFVDMLCILAVFQNEEAPEDAIDRIGSMLPPDSLISALEPHKRTAFPKWSDIRSIFMKLAIKSGESDDMPLSALMNSGELSPLEFLAVLFSYAASENMKYGQIYSILMGIRDRTTFPSAGFISDMGRFFMTDNEYSINSICNRDSFFNLLLVANKDEIYDAERTIHLKPSVLRFLRGQGAELGDLGLIASYVEAPSAAFICHEKELKELEYVYATMQALETQGVIELSGEPGSGKRFLVSLTAQKNLENMLSVDLRKLFALSPEMQHRLCEEIVLHSAIGNAVIYLYGVEEKGETMAATIRTVAALQKKIAVLFIGTDRPLSDKVGESFAGSLFRLTIPETDSAAQQSLWEEALSRNNAELSEDVSLQEVVSKYTMNPGRIFEAVTNTVAVSEAKDEGFIIEKLALEEQIRRICSTQFGENAVRLKSAFTWDDLVVEPESREYLKMACDRIIYKSKVNEEFGFGKKLPYGRGVSIVLYGPPGTGKTMAAQVLSNELGLDMYRIDLSQISSKYIGETEKNLGSVFDAAKNSNAILFFDEADSLFAKRTEVTSSNDKHANAETAYLLQKIEEYSGVSILATNNMANFDAAFKRRMTYMIPIGIPDEATRCDLWKKSFPKEAPLDESVDFSILSKAVELSGSNIKSSAIAAAYRAAAKGRKITMEDIAEAVDMECRKIGRMGAKNEILQAVVMSNAEEEQ
ncbi:MAG: ATP-binding protein [Lachnospiraceae bacterium]|nr:ATP-binding protein [Lachnospiraceae bacterium]